MKMASALPSIESRRNGLHGINRQLVEEPEKPLVCIVILDSSQTLIDHDKHTKTATVRIHHIEPLLTVDGRREAVELLSNAYRARTTEQLELSYDIDLGSAWDERDPVSF